MTTHEAGTPTPETGAFIDDILKNCFPGLSSFEARVICRALADAEQRAAEASRRAEGMKVKALAGVSDLPGLIGALRNQKQCDEEGQECQVSRQAVDEAISVLVALKTDAGGVK